jgi:catechol 2,3-dioxygenase-like lactoylglutathione lyase family enzyme
MTIALDHMSVATKDKVATAQFYAQLFGGRFEGTRRDYAPVIVNEGLTLNFEEAEQIETRHYAFRMEPPEWQRVKVQLTVDEIPFGDSTRTSDGSIYERGGLKGFFFKDPNGHSVEIITHD